MSREGVAFMPDDASDQAKDGFNLPYHEILHALDGDSLMIRSADRAYRFKSDGEGGTGGLETLVESIDRLRSARRNLKRLLLLCSRVLGP